MQFISLAVVCAINLSIVVANDLLPECIFYIDDDHSNDYGACERARHALTERMHATVQEMSLIGKKLQLDNCEHLYRPGTCQERTVKVALDNNVSKPLLMFGWC